MNGIVLYDGECDFCTRWLKFWTPLLRGHGFGVDTLQAPWVATKIQMTLPELLTDIRLLEPNGKLISGADAYIHVMHVIWWTRPLAVLCSLPGLNRLFRAGYRAFARNRYCVSGKCRVDL